MKMAIVALASSTYKTVKCISDPEHLSTLGDCVIAETPIYRIMLALLYFAS